MNLFEKERLAIRRSKRTIVVFWGADSPASLDFARRLGADFHKVHCLKQNRPWLAPIRYLFMFFKTMLLLRSLRPKAVLVVNSPVFAPLTVFLYCRMAQIPYVMDIHGHSFIGWKWAWSRPLHGFLARRAKACLVDHTFHEHLFRSWGANTLLLERPLITPATSKVRKDILSKKFTLTLINTFAGDEPLEPLIRAAAYLPQIRFVVLGDIKMADARLLQNAPDNVCFPGYLLADQYWAQLSISNVVMILTNTPYSLVSGGIEGLVLGKPLILSSQPVLMDYFTQGALFVKHNPQSIKEAVLKSMKEEKTLKMQSLSLLAEKRSRWDSEFEKLLKIMEELC